MMKPIGMPEDTAYINRMVDEKLVDGLLPDEYNPQALHGKLG